MTQAIPNYDSFPSIRCSKVEDFHYESNQNPIQLFDVEQNFPLETEEGRSSCPITSRTNLQRDELAYGEGDHTADNTPKNNLTRLQRLSIFKMNHNAISIQVLNPVAKDGVVDKYVVYTIKGSDKDGSFEVQRTQQQFLEIRALLVARWPGCYIPATPPKRIMTKTTPNFLEQRRKQYEMFCQKMSEIQYLHYSPEYQIFLRSSNTDLHYELSRFPRADYMEIMSRLDATFPEALSKDITTHTFEKIQQFKEFLEGTQEPFKRYKKNLKGIVKSRRKYLGQFDALQETIASGFETKVLSGYEEGTESEFGKFDKTLDLRESAVKIKVTAQVDPLEFLHAWMKAEERESQGFLDSINQRERLISLRGRLLEKQKNTQRTLEKAAMGNLTLKIFFSTKSKEAEMSKMEKQIANWGKEVELLKALIEKVTLVVAYSEIDKYRKKKAEQYHHVIDVASQNELVKLRDMSEFWVQMLRKNNESGNAKNISTYTSIKSSKTDLE